MIFVQTPKSPRLIRHHVQRKWLHTICIIGGFRWWKRGQPFDAVHGVGLADFGVGQKQPQFSTGVNRVMGRAISNADCGRPFVFKALVYYSHVCCRIVCLLLSPGRGCRTIETVLHKLRKKLHNRRRGDREPNLNTHTHTRPYSKHPNWLVVFDRGGKRVQHITI